MTTKDHCLPLKGKNGLSDTSNDRYSSLNLNRKHQCFSVVENVHSKNFSNKSKQAQNYEKDCSLTKQLSDLIQDTQKSKASLSWKKSESKLPSEYLNIHSGSDKNESKEGKDLKGKSKNGSTLSLHIAAYENSTEAAASNSIEEKDKSNFIKTLENFKHMTLSSDISNPFEFPRQQTDDSSAPAIMQFSASQRLLKPNQENEMSSRYAKKRKHELDSDTSAKKSHSSSDRSDRHRESKKSRRRESSSSPTPDGNSNADSMSIEETNKMRASLGLAPLEVDDGPKIRDSESGDPKEKIVTEDGMEFVHKPSENLAQKKKTEKIKEKLELQKQKRIVQSKLKTKGLADTSSDEEDNAESWVEKQRRLAEQKARELEQMDEDAEKASAAVPVRAKAKKPATTRPKDATSGMTVGHSKEQFLSGQEHILVLDDKGVLDEDGDEVLVDPTMMYAEQLKKNREIREKKSGYNPYDEEEVDEFGQVKRKDLLSKYDEGIDGPQNRETFKLDEHGGVDVNREAEELQQKRNLFMANRKLQTLETPKYKIASEFYTEEEMISFRKPKKKKDGTKSRKRKGQKVDELLPEPEQETLEERKAREERLKARRRENGDESAAATESKNGNGIAKDDIKMEIDKEEGEIEDEIPEIKKDRFRNTMGATVDKSKMHSLLSKIKKREEEDDEEEDDFESTDNLAGIVIDDEVEDEYSAELEKARKLREIAAKKDAEIDSGAQVKAMLSKIKTEEDEEMEVDADSEGPKQIIFDSTSEYYKTIGNIPTIGLAGNRDDDVDYSEVLAEQAKELAEKEERAQRRKEHQHEKERRDEDSEDDERRHRKKEKKRSHRERDRNGDERKDREKDDRKHREKDRRQRHHRDRSSSPEAEDEKKKSKDKSDKDKYENVLGKEADVTKGVAGMLKLAGEKGYLEDPNAKRLRGGTLKHLESKNYAKLEFNKYDIDDKHLKKLERMGTTGSGPLRSFPEKRDYVPNVEIAYTDAQGRDMDQKAAFRVLSHKFHGKAPGKKQIEKRMRQQEKKEKLKKMNSSDTPLGTLSKQIKKQEQLQSHFLVLSGGRSGGDPNAPLQKD